MKQFSLCMCMWLFISCTAQAQEINNGTPPAPPPDSARFNSYIFTKVDVEASFPGGQEGWQQFLVKNLHPEKIADYVKIPRRQKVFKQTVIVKFVVSRDGTLSDIAAENSGAVDPYCAAEAVRVIKISPNWIPASQNGRKVNAYRRQPITFVFE